MDMALFSKNDGWGKCKRIIDTVEKLGGVLTILWHSVAFNENEFPDWTNIYKELITLCKKKNAWITTAGEIEEWWNSR
jgi:hypothetical protein